MNPTDDIQSPDDVSSDDAAQARILNPFLFNMHGADGTHGFSSRNSTPRLTLVQPDELDDEDAAPACLRINSAVQEIPVEPDETPSPQPAVSVIEWAGGDIRAWRSTETLQTATPTPAPSPPSTSISRPAPEVRPEAKPAVMPVVNEITPRATTDVIGFPRVVVDAAKSMMTRFTKRLTAVRVWLRIVAWGLVRRISVTAVGIRAWRRPRLYLGKRWQVFIPALRQWIAARASSKLLAEFRWHLMFKWAGGTAACGIGFIMVMRTLLT